MRRIVGLLRLSPLKELGDFFSFSFRIRRLIILALIITSVLPGVFYWQMPGILRYGFILGYTWLIILAVMSQGWFLVKIAKMAILSTLFSRKYRAFPYSTPPIGALIAKMGLSGKARIFVSQNPYVTGAYTNAITSRVYIPNNWVQSLPESEMIAILAHELSHIKTRGRFAIELSLGLAAGFAVATFLLVISTVVLTLVYEVAEVTTAYLAASFVSWRNEFRADRLGGTTTGPEGLISVFELFQSEYGDEGSETHPPLSSRIKRLVRLLDNPSDQKSTSQEAQPE